MEKYEDKIAESELHLDQMKENKSTPFLWLQFLHALQVFSSF